MKEFGGRMRGHAARTVARNLSILELEVVGAPIAMLNAAAVKSLLTFIDETAPIDAGPGVRQPIERHVVQHVANRKSEVKWTLARRRAQDARRPFPYGAWRSDLNDARISETKFAGCSQAAKCPPLGNLL